MDDFGRWRLAQIIEKIEINDFSTEDWNETLSYLTGEQKQETAADAKRLLCKKLTK